MERASNYLSLGGAVMIAVALSACRGGTPEKPIPGVGESTGTSDKALQAIKPGGAVAPSEGDRNFAEKAAAAGMAEVQIAEHAKAHAASDRVRQLAEKLERDHKAANEELKKVAAEAGIALPAKTPTDKQQAVDEVKKLKGAELDRTVVGKLEQSHMDSIALFEQEAKSGSNDKLKSFAEKTLPTLREHLKMLQGTKQAAATPPPGKSAKQ